MKWIIAGLGNPGGDYAKTRHNAGRIILDQFRVIENFPEWEKKKTYSALVSKGAIDEMEVILVEPETFMNESGRSFRTLVKSKKQAEQFVVIHDDIDLPLGTWKFSFERGSAGQKGVESIINTLKTKSFIRVRVGILHVTPDGVTRKPKGAVSVQKFVLGTFTEDERVLLNKVGGDISKALKTLFTEGLPVAMNQWNQKPSGAGN